VAELPFLSQDTPNPSGVDFSSLTEKASNFDTYGPAAFEQASGLFGVSALTDYATLGVLRGADPNSPLKAVIRGIFSSSDDAESTIPPEQANKEFGFNENNEQILSFNKPVSRAEAQFVRDKKIDELARLKILDKLEGLDFAGSLGIELLAEVADPLGLAGFLIPAARVNSFGRGFIEGAASVGLSILPGTLRNVQIQAQFQAQQAVLSVIAGGVFSGTINKVLGVADTAISTIKNRAKTEVIHAESELEIEPVVEFHQDVFNASLISSLNGLDPNLPGKFADFASKQGTDNKIKGINKSIVQLTNLRQQVENAAVNPQQKLALRKVNSKILELNDIKRKLSNKALSGSADALEETQRRTRELNKNTPVSRESTVTRGSNIESKTHQNERLETQFGKLEKSIAEMKAGQIGSVPKFLASLKEITGANNIYGELFDDALKDQVLLNQIIEIVSEVRASDKGFSLEDSFIPGTNKGNNIVDGEVVPIIDTKPFDMEHIRDDFEQKIRYLAISNSRAFKAEGKLSSINEEEAFQVARLSVGKDLKETLRQQQKNPSSSRAIENDVEPSQEVESSLNRTRTLEDLEDFNQNLTVESQLEISAATQGKAIDQQSLEELLTDPNFKGSEKQTRFFKELAETEAAKNAELEKVSPRIEAMIEAIRCARSQGDIPIG
jgi:hypothetical protein